MQGHGYSINSFSPNQIPNDSSGLNIYVCYSSKSYLESEADNFLLEQDKTKLSFSNETLKS